MESKYTLRPGLTWHDGHPLTADDFAFTRPAELYVVESGIEQIRPEVREMDDIVAQDPLTVVIRWKRPYTEAAAPEQIAFPRHILEPSLLQGDPEAFRNHSYWTLDYVGAGPYRIDHWERGSYIEASAFPGFALGAPDLEQRHQRQRDPTPLRRRRHRPGWLAPLRAGEHPPRPVAGERRRPA